MSLGVDAVAEPDFFADLHLDQVVASLVAGREEYDLAPFFYARCTTSKQSITDTTYWMTWSAEPVLEAVRAFADGMQPDAQAPRAGE